MKLSPSATVPPVMTMVEMKLEDGEGDGDGGDGSFHNSPDDSRIRGE